MHDFLLKEIHNTDLINELKQIGFDSNYTAVAKEKFEYRNIKIFDVNVAQANIIKQTALSVGADCATHRDVITGNIEKSSCILGGSVSQLKKISQKLKFQPFSLKVLGGKIDEILSFYEASKTKIVGILNITKDSFSDGGMFYDFDSGIKHLHELIEDGADIIDIGAESTRPGAFEIDAKTQIERLVPVLEYINKNNIKIPVSIDTRSSEVARVCIDNGTSIINDVSGFDYDKKMPDVISKNCAVKVIIQHSQGTPDKMQNNPSYENLMDDIYSALYAKICSAIDCGIKKENIIVDPGIGFGKTRNDNLEIIRRWEEFKTFGCPVMLGVSRKSFLGMPDSDNEEKDLYTLAINSVLINSNIDYIRVHNVKIHKKLMEIYKC